MPRFRPVRSAATELSLGEALAALDPAPTESERAQLRRQRVRSLLDVARWNAGTRNKHPLGEKTWESLSAQAAFASMPTTAEANARLYAAGFADPSAITALPREEFVARVGRRLSRPAAESVYMAAQAQQRLLVNARLGVATGSTSLPGNNATPTLPCNCDNCQSATSPAAYLADLLDYAVEHLSIVEISSGLRGQYFADSFSTPVAERIDAQINFDWGFGAPMPRIPADGFAVRWTGSIYPRYSEPYDIAIRADNGVEQVRLWVNERLVISPSSWTDNSRTERSAQVVLQAGTESRVRLEYENLAGPAQVSLLWASYSQQREVVPAACLSTARGTDALTLSKIETRIGQPYRRLLNDCRFVQNKVNRARIATEALRTLLPVANQAYNDPDQNFAVYDFLLAQLGTSYTELRSVVADGNQKVRRDFAERLGISVRGLPDHLNELLLDPKDPGFGEYRLEGLFGYASTSKPPLTPDDSGEVLAWQGRVLRSRWAGEDRSPAPTHQGGAIIDPDIVGSADLVDPSPTAVRPRTPRRPMDFLEDRRHYLDIRHADVREVLLDANAGIQSLITDSFTDVNGVERPLLGLGLGMRVADFSTVLTLQRAGEDVESELRAVNLDPEGLEYLGKAWENSQKFNSLSAVEIDAVTAILVQAGKRSQFGTWRQEEATAGIILAPDLFRLRPAPRPGFEFPWTPRPFRATAQQRRHWENALRRRIAEEEKLEEGWRLAIGAAEERFRLLQRDRIRLLYSQATPKPLPIDRLADRLQIDLQSTACDSTTRVGQAIQSIQGLLHGARNGLLKADPLLLDDPKGFDAAWDWLGSYTSWRSALNVFLHPENTLRPTLRRDSSSAFSAIIEEMRDAGTLSPEMALTHADAYSRYFRDVASLRFEALGRVSPPDGPATILPWYLIIARGSHTGSLYACVQDVRPDRWLRSGYSRSTWERVPGGEIGVAVDGVVNYRTAGGRSASGLYLRSGPAGNEKRIFIRHDGTGWSSPRDHNSPQLVTACLQVELPPSTRYANTGGSAWRLNGTESAAVLDMDGDGRHEVLLFGRPSAAPWDIAMLRESAGGLVLDNRAQLATGWRAPNESPVVLRTTLEQSPQRRREQLLLVGTVGGQQALGLLGLRGGKPALVATAVGSVTDGAGAIWPIPNAAKFVSADVDGDGFSELVAIESLDPTSHRLTVLRIREDSITLLSSQTYIATEYWGAFTDNWRHHLPVELQPIGETLFVHREWPWESAENNGNLTGFRWDPVTRALVEAVPPLKYAALRQDSPEPIGFDPNDRRRPPGLWLITGSDRISAARLGLGGTGEQILLTNSKRPDTAVIHPSDLRMVWRSAQTIPGSANTRDWLRRTDDTIIAADLNGDGKQDLVLLRRDGSELSIAASTGQQSLAIRWFTSTPVRGPGEALEQSWVPGEGGQLLVGDFDGDGCEEVLSLRVGVLSILRGIPPVRRASELGVSENYGPSSVIEFNPAHPGLAGWNDQRLARIQECYEANNASALDWIDPDLIYLDEAYYFLPVEFAIRLQDSGQWTPSLDWLRGVYDYADPPQQRRRAFLLVLDNDRPSSWARAADWFRDPLNPHLIARSRRGSYNRFTVLTIARCLIGAGDEEFAHASEESLPRARAFYERALDLLRGSEFRAAAGCADIIGTLDIQVGDDELRFAWLKVLDDLRTVTSLPILTSAIRDIQRLFLTNPALDQSIGAAAARAKSAQRADLRTRSGQDRLASDLAVRSTMDRLLIANEDFTRVTRGVQVLLARARPASRVAELAPDGLPSLTSLQLYPAPYIPAPRASFCVPRNPVVASLSRNVELNLEKLRDCRNISGARRRVDSDEVAGVRGTSGTLPSRRRGIQPLPYRYTTLVERAGKLVDLAARIEQSMLGAIEAGERSRYEELRARHDLGIARGAVLLKELQFNEAIVGERAAQLQTNRSLSVATHYRNLLRTKLSSHEASSLDALHAAEALHEASAHASAAGAGWITGWITGSAVASIASGLSSLAAAASTQAQIHSIYASFERRQEEWRLQERVSRFDIELGEQQIRAAQIEASIAARERDLASMQVEHASEVLDYLILRRFANAELYEWMAALLEQIYRFFLQQATAMAQLAEAQLSFERQEVTPQVIRDAYWQTASASPAFGGQPERRGLTGSARLLRDLTELDQYAFRTERRKLQLSKTFSLAELDPIAFQRFRSTGVLPFHTSLLDFDRDFPGHYLRLVKRVRTTVIGLISPIQGIHAELSTTGFSRTVVAGDTFETVVILRPPETIALTSPIEDTGVFALNPQPDLQAPFEGMGTDADWELRLPLPSNQFPFSDIADVYFSVDYTALASPDHKSDIIRQLDTELVADRAFLFRNEFADAWYDLHNPQLVDAPAQPMVVTFRTTRQDFPPNAENLTIRNLALVFTCRDSSQAEIQIADLALNDGSGWVHSGALTSEDGIISSRRSSGVPLHALLARKPVGEWTLSLAHGDAAIDTEIRRRFGDKEIVDATLVISFAGNTPPWPT